eukprot:JP437207.1.p1 GENE.JP437207.1~~JP437207.1.p1  ORF type:complete len:186 (+),score=16.99 JP437207.1:27-560(+)
MEHLTCFTGGLFALGAHTMDKNRADYKSRYARDMGLAANLTYTCWQMYDLTPTKLAAEDTRFDPGTQNPHPGNPVNIQRPETMESLFIMWRLTHDNKYRDWGWKMMQAFEKAERVEGGGYSGLRSVNQNPPLKDDVMQTFWLAETLKYAFLLFSPDDVMPLDEWVFNTEAHPVKLVP